MIVDHNGGDSILRTIRSIREQTEDVGLLIVDAGSSDGSADQIRRDFPDAVICPLSFYPGHAHAANCGLRLVRTPYALLAEPGVLLEKKAVRVLKAAMEADPMAFAAQALVVSEEAPRRILSGGRTFTAFGRALDEGFGLPEEKAPRLHRIQACGYAALYRLTALEETGWFDERHYQYLEEIDLGLRAMLYGFHALSVPQARCLAEAPSFSEGTGAARAALTAGNALYLRYKNLYGPFDALTAPLRLLASLGGEKDGLEEARRGGLERGRALCALSAEEDSLRAGGQKVTRRPLPEEALVDTDEEADRLYPLFLGGRIYRTPDMAPALLRLRLSALKGCGEEIRQRLAGRNMKTERGAALNGTQNRRRRHKQL